MIKNMIEDVRVTLVVVFLVIILAIFGATAQDTVSNPEAQQIIKDTTNSGINLLLFFLVISGIVGTIGLGIFFYKMFTDYVWG